MPRHARPDSAWLSGRFAGLIEDPDRRTSDTLVGAEHEYRVVAVADGTPVDFRGIVHGLELGRSRLDPDDPYAYRLPSGNVITCDEAEAEIVLAPVPLARDAGLVLAAAGLAEREALCARLPSGLSLNGHSTHISVSVATDLIEAVGRLFATTFAADLVRLVDSPDRCGVWVRPRPDRLELCVDFIDGPSFGTALAFAAGATRACEASVSGERTVLPPAVRAFARRPRHRSGWNLPRAAFHGDPFGSATDAPLELEDGAPIPAADHLALAWAAVRPFVPSDQTVAEDLPARAFGDALRPGAREGFEVAVVALTWRFAALLLLRPARWWRRERRAFAVVPRAALPAFLDGLDAGRLDEVIGAYLAARPTARVLERPDQVGEPGLFDTLGLRRGLLPPEPIVAPFRAASSVVTA